MEVVPDDGELQPVGSSLRVHRGEELPDAGVVEAADDELEHDELDRLASARGSFRAPQDHPCGWTTTPGPKGKRIIAGPFRVPARRDPS